jgi:hypothetical protein
VGSSCIGHGATHEEAERKAQAYVATDQMIHRQNEAVMKSYMATDSIKPTVQQVTQHDKREEKRQACIL